MTGHKLGVHGRVADSETQGTPDSQLCVQDGGRIVRTSHGASSRWMVYTLHPVPNDLAQLLVAQLVKVVIEKRVSGADVSHACQGSRMGDLIRATDTANERIDIMLGRKVAEDNSSMGTGKKGTKTDFGSMTGWSQGSADLI